MGAIIAAFGTKGHRYATSNSSMMLHSVAIQSPADDIHKHMSMMEFVKNDYSRKVSDMAKRMKISKKKLIELMEETKWMSPKQAIKIGLIDKIWTPRMERQVSGKLNQC
jgi:ATP-dependent protease ClpP protease subunit